MQLTKLVSSIKAPIKIIMVSTFFESRCWGCLTLPLNNVVRCWDMSRRVWFCLNFTSTSSQHGLNISQHIYWLDKCWENVETNVETVWSGLKTSSVGRHIHMPYLTYLTPNYRPYNIIIIIISSQCADSKAHCLLLNWFFTFLYSLCQKVGVTVIITI